MTPSRVALPAVLAGALGYLALGFALFGMPATLADAEPWGFLPEAFAAAAGGLSGGMMGVLGITAAGIGAIGFEPDRRRRQG